MAGCGLGIPKNVAILTCRALQFNQDFRLRRFHFGSYTPRGDVASGQLDSAFGLLAAAPIAFSELMGPL
jgi:hypothetical protein